MVVEESLSTAILEVLLHEATAHARESKAAAGNKWGGRETGLEGKNGGRKGAGIDGFDGNNAYP